MDQNQNFPHKKLEGALTVIYWCFLVGGILMIAGVALSVLPNIVGILFGGFSYLFRTLVTSAANIIGAVLYIVAAKQLKDANPRFVDNYFHGVAVMAVGNIISSFMYIFSLTGITTFVGNVIGSAISLAIAVVIAVMYLSKSKRVEAYFGEKPLPKSNYWTYLSKLPAALTSDAPISAAQPADNNPYTAPAPDSTAAQNDEPQQ